MNALDVRAAVVDGLAAALPDGTQVVAHRGRFDSDAEIRRYSVRSPTVLVAIGEFAPVGANDLVTISLAAFVVTRDVPGLPRDAAAIAVVQQILVTLRAADWGVDAATAPANVRARNLYAQKIDKLGVGLWGVSWDQRFTLDAMDWTTLEAFLTFHDDTDMAPADGQIDISETDTLAQ